YPAGIPIYPEEELDALIRTLDIDQVVFAYSDVPHEYVMHKASQVLAAGADFRLMGTKETMLKAKVPVVSVCAVRTGSGKSQTTRRVSDILRQMGKKVVVVRHPMPYGNLVKQICQRFANYDDLDKYECTIEEREEYEPHLDRGTVVYAGVDYEQILHQAEQEAEILLWDGGNNDLPFFQPDLHIVVTDPHRAGHELRYHPGEANLRMADVVVINKIDTSQPDKMEIVRHNILAANPRAVVVDAASPIFVDDPQAIRGRKVLVVEDGPTLTHGEMSYGAGVVAARRFGAAEIIDPRPYAVGSIAETYRKYPNTGPVLPAMGYGAKQIQELEETINATPCDLVIVATPIDLCRVIKINRPMQRVRYELQEIGRPTLQDVLSVRFKPS
ncbi:MAG: cyclic 2,3-diphosphoglycerate synthase, partial [Anaerolineae bacterium]